MNVPTNPLSPVAPTPPNPEHVRLAIDLLRAELSVELGEGITGNVDVGVRGVSMPGRISTWPGFVFSAMRSPTDPAANAQIAESLQLLLHAAQENMLTVSDTL